ncbi:hypothetical protein EXIGLDRAFT_720444 [Exidia glandulosa HHB12029]|uniref:CoA-dependent acyltransferase n=1 Tax=Exidia glandulosa HHB12029 TaxID=1314781 RepID=A0A165NJG4_EXIGL|nr:hypothetical protein EXIGLDRAFT_720444 [Exidia glandulosa HHB12029]
MGDAYEPSLLDQVPFRAYISHLVCIPASALPTQAVLRAGLAKVLRDAPFLAGFVNPIPGSSWAQITGPYDTDAVDDLFEYRESNMDYESWRAAKFCCVRLLKEERCDFPPPDTYPAPVLRARSNTMRGGATLAVWFHHIAMDASGAARVWAAWTAACRNDPEQLELTLCPRYVPPDSGPPGNIELHPGYTFDPAPRPFPPSVTAYFHFPDAALARLKTRVTGEGRWVSSHDAMSALLWTCIARIMGREATMGLAVVVNARSRLDPPLTASYVGNCIYNTVAPTPVPSSFPNAARAIRAVVDSVDAARLADFASLIASSSTRRIFEAHHHFAAGTGPLLVTFAAQMGLVDLDWGAGVKAEHALHPALLMAGLVVVQPKHVGGLDVIVGLERQHMDALLHDEEFAEYARWESGYGSVVQSAVP